MIVSKGRVAALIFGIAIGSTGAAAGELASYEGTCLAPIAAYKEGLPELKGTDAMNADQKIVETTKMFRSVMTAFAEVQSCHQQMMEGEGASEKFASLYEGTRETSRVFDLVQGQFESQIEEMSAAALSGVAPAAGADSEADLEAESQTFNTMEILMDSYMALERSQELKKSLLKVSG
ncbi:MAG: hypothetical protein HWE08_05625 [Alphaproteobacteria bacterium]|nr:hypothetical protein [Alphaproteobacteria bacterium]